MPRRRWVVVSLLASSAVAAADARVDLAPDAVEDQARAVVGGENVPPGMWPDTVAVLGDDGACTGTLIAPDVVLTAGHCASINPTQVIAATTDYATSNGVRVAVEKTTAYPNWESSYDIAVIVLASPITSVPPRKVATSCTFNAFAPNTAVRLVGFGATSMDGTASNTQLKQAMTAVTDPDCSSGDGCNAAIAPGGEFVAGGGGTADSCFGDSGGPVYLDTINGAVLVGAVSRGVASSTTPCGGGGIYVRTDKIIEWIETTSGKTIAKEACPTGDTVGAEETDDAVGTDEIGGCSTSNGAGLAMLLGFAFLRRRSWSGRVGKSPCVPSGTRAARS